MTHPVPSQPGAVPPTGGPTGQLVVTIQGSALTSGLITPTLMVDGHQMPSSYGANWVSVPAGPHRVELFAQWWRRYGHATLDIQVAPNSVTQVWYAAPMTVFVDSGSIGFEKQRAKGVVAAVVIPFVGVAVVLLTTLLLIWAVFFAGAPY